MIIMIMGIFVHFMYFFTSYRNNSVSTNALEESMGISASDLIPDTGISINIDGQNVGFDLTAAETGSIEASCDPGQELIGLICGEILYFIISSLFDH